MARGYIKICGITSLADVEMVLDAGADAIGLNLWPRSPRFVSNEQAARLARVCEGRADIFIVTVDMAPPQLAAAIAVTRPRYVQLHGDESPGVAASLAAEAVFAVGLRDASDVQRALHLPGDLVLVDARDDGLRGGTGRLAPVGLAAQVARARKTLLAGGLHPSNVAAAVATVRPFGIDCASGVESAPGVKNQKLVEAFVQAAREAFGAVAGNAAGGE